jgi:molecular chaperone GrpE
LAAFFLNEEDGSKVEISDTRDGKRKGTGDESQGHEPRSGRGTGHDAGHVPEASAEAARKRRHSRRELEAALAKVSSEMEDAKIEIEQTKDKFLRALADFDNFRKRIAREREERTRCADEDLIKHLLEVVDNMERALAASTQDVDAESLKRGMGLIYEQLKDVLTKQGLCPIKCLGQKFDPNYHEAIMQIEKDGAEPENVVEEVQKGYLLNGRVIRPSKVVVSK